MQAMFRPGLQDNDRKAEKRSLENRKKQNMNEMYKWIYEALGALQKEPTETNRKIAAKTIAIEIAEKYKHIENENLMLKNDLAKLKNKLPAWHFMKKEC